MAKNKDEKKNEAEAAAPEAPPAVQPINVDEVLGVLAAAADERTFHRLGEELLGRGEVPPSVLALPEAELHRLKEGVRVLAARFSGELAAPDHERPDGLETPGTKFVGVAVRPVPNLDALRAALADTSTEEEFHDVARAYAVGHPDWSRYDVAGREAVKAVLREVSLAKWPPPPEPEAAPAAPVLAPRGPRKLACVVSVLDVHLGRRVELPIGTPEDEVKRRAHPDDWRTLFRSELWA